MRVQNRVSAHKASDRCWVFPGTEDDSPSYLLYAQELHDDWWEFILAQVQDILDQEYFCFETEIFRSRFYSRGGAGITTSLTNMARDIVSDEVRIDAPTDFRDFFGGEIVGFGDEETQLWH